MTIGVDTIIKKLNVNETNCSQAKLSLIRRNKTLWRNKLETEAVTLKGKLRTYFSFKSVFQNAKVQR